MGTIKALRIGLQSLRLPQQIVKIIQSGEPYLTQAERDRLYKKSIDSLGVPLKFYRSIGYSLDKSKLNSQPGFGRPDLYLTGSFYKGFNLNVGYTGVMNFDSTDSKTDKLTAKYGVTIFGLTKEQKTEYALNVFYPKLKDYIYSKTGLKFR